jgi:hypothetical protein
MEAGVRRDIAINVFMTIAAQAVLASFLEASMTTRTLRFVLGVSRDDLTGHEQRFDVSGVGNGRH